MKTELKIYTVEQICDGFEYNELEGLVLCSPEYVVVDGGRI